MYSFLEFLSFFLRELLVPLVTIVVTVGALVVAFRRGLFARSRPVQGPQPQRERIYVQGNVVGDIHLVEPSNAQKIAIDASKIDEYHQQSISQSKISFWFSIVFASLGFLIIATSVFAYSEKSGYLGVAAGTIIDAVAALFFNQSNRARLSMAEFFDRLRTDRKIEEALRLCEVIDDASIRDALRVKLSLHFAEITGSEESLGRILGHCAEPPEPRPLGEPSVDRPRARGVRRPEGDVRTAAGSATAATLPLDAPPGFDAKN